MATIRGMSTQSSVISFVIDKVFYRLKDKIELTKNSGVVYGISCQNCPAIYVGETHQYLSKRISEHKY